MTLESLIVGSPLRQDEDGVIRVGKTRVSLDSVLYAYSHGASAERIADKYPSLQLADIYAAIAYYLWNRDAVDAYLAEGERADREAMQWIDENYPREGVRERLLARLREPEAPR